MKKYNHKHLFILGAPKAGTTSLHRYLDQHPEICMSNPKEPRFLEYDREYNQGLQYYLDTYFTHASDQKYLGEARPWNLYFPWVSRRIQETFHDPKLIVLVREPVQRLFSHVLHARRRGQESLGLEKAIFEDFRRIKQGKIYETPEEKEQYQNALRQGEVELYRKYLDGGYYARQIDRYQQLFSEESMKILLAEELFEQPLRQTNKILDFLGVDQLNSLDQSPANQGFSTRSKLYQRFVSYLAQSNLLRSLPQSIKDQARQLATAWNKKPKPDPLEENPVLSLWLSNHYAERNRRLADQTDLDLTEWKQSNPYYRQGSEQ